MKFTANIIHNEIWKIFPFRCRMSLDSGKKQEKKIRCMTWKERNKTVITLVNLFKNLCEAQRWVKRTKMCLVAVGAVSLLKNQLYFYIPETNNNKSLKLYFTIAKRKKIT